ncbi:MAG: type II toxin-antitoxin system RelE/ParE family toxin [Candidatus Methanoperedens sp.]|nr:type II toxin-antitoxin system RelE/ParE family toxin [Candidatus Methanoperedens sp.]
MKPIRFHPEAEAEMISAAVFYETKQKDLGKRFLTSVQNALNKIQVNPLLYQEIEEGVRRCLTTTFPFGVVFRIMPDQYVIIAVMHLHRAPGYWKSRVP